ncbi:amino acid ABC transporter permease [Paraburkholderia susongensis]|uniref:Amino acid ABC transporter membrane protein 1, PAAT family n=1 Tax=Paraburkholderia susongensis TaxID=1515439 RepID=A0A1X7M267_9BURK|nr:amino acid ABC transporter permease [Paraburkholderia susongensis]SMG59854.1 amino acid ABC transporter membrane protein 1, PAAT family [Paraburkholderia susongensis]
MDGWLEPKYLAWIAHGFLLTLVLSACAGLAATLLGFVLALARDARNAVIARVAALYVLAFRNSPLLVQLLFWYFGAATLLPQHVMEWLNASHTFSLRGWTLAWPPFEFVAGWVGLTCYTTAFIGEEFRAGMRGVKDTQHQAAAALGLAPLAAFRYVILPQAIRIATPPLAGQYMNLVKNSSLTMTIGLAELSYVSRQIDTETFKTFQAFGAATVLYIAIIASLEAALLVWKRHGARAWQGGHS